MEPYPEELPPSAEHNQLWVQKVRYLAKAYGVTVAAALMAAWAVVRLAMGQLMPAILLVTGAVALWRWAKEYWEIAGAYQAQMHTGSLYNWREEEDADDDY